MKGRIYDPLAARFTSADPMMQAPFWSQGLNRYSYVFNNPVNNTDPSGFYSSGDASNELGIGLGGYGAGLIGGAFGGALGVGLPGANIASSLIFGGGYGGGSAAGKVQSVTPSAAPTTRTSSRGSSVMTHEVKGGVGAPRPPSACDVGMCLAQQVPAAEGGPGYDVRSDGTGGGAPATTTNLVDKVISLLGGEVTLAINIVTSLEQIRRELLARMVPAPKDLPAYPGVQRAKPKTPVQGGGGLRKRWKSAEGEIYEWDSQHGRVEKYDKRGKHLGEFDPRTGDRTGAAIPGRSVEP